MEKITHEFLEKNGFILFECIIGSQAYGTQTPTSDVDKKFVYILPQDYILGTGYIEQLNVNKDYVGWELKRFLELMGSSNPTVLELLNTPEDCIITKHPLFQYVLDHKADFITKGCKNSFAGYAVQQIQKARGLNKKQNWEKDKVTRKDVLDFVYVIEGQKSIPWKVWNENNGRYDEKFCGVVNVPNARDLYAVYFDYDANNCFNERIPEDMREAAKAWRKEEGLPMGFGYKGLVKTGEGQNVAESNQLRLSSIPKGETPICNIIYNKDGYSTHCKDYKEYEEWLANRNEQRYVQTTKEGEKIDCYLDSDTDYLTENGWMKYDDITSVIKIASIDNEGCIVYDNYLDKVKKKHTGEIYTYHTRYSRFSVTPNHNLLVNYISRSKKNGFTTSLNKIDINDFEYIKVSDYLSKRKNYARIIQAPLINNNIEYDIKDTEIKLLGAYISDGCINSNRIHIDQLIGRPLDSIICNETLTSTIKYGDKNQYIRHVYKNDKLINFINKYIKQGSLNKCLSGDIFKFSTRQVNLLLEYMILGDGTVKKCGSRVYYTSSEKLAESLQLLLFIHGINSQIYIVENKGGYKSSTLIKYQVFITKENTKTGLINKHKSWDVKNVNDEYVSCFTTKYGNLITRNNNKIAIQGNCKNMMHCMRLIRMSKEIGRGEGIQVRRADREYLLSIRKGEIDLDSLIETAEAEIKEMDYIFEDSNLPDKIDANLVNTLLIKIRREFYGLL